MSGFSLRLKDPDRDHLRVGAAALGVALDTKAIGELARFADLLDVWGQKMNLLSCRSAHELLTRHFLDSLAVAAALPEDGRVVDLGTGAGLPGIPLAILRPEQQFVLVDARRRRVSFIQEVRRTLGLSNLEVWEGRAEEPPPELRSAARAVVSRAAFAEVSFLEVAQQWLESEGLILWMRTEPLVHDSGSFVRRDTLRYRIGSDRLRCVEVLARRAPEIGCFT